MGYALKTVPAPQAILRAWMPFKQLVGVTSVRHEEDYAQARATIDVLLDEVGDDASESSPVALHHQLFCTLAHVDGRRRHARHRDRNHCHGVPRPSS